MACESLDTLFADESKSWYHYLLQAMRAPFDRFRLNRLSVITFNYDLSLERYLHTCLQNSYNKPLHEVADQLASIQIVHVYGQLGTFNGQPLDPSCSPESISRAAEGIKIVAEHRDDPTEFPNARELLLGAERILFIGFGYDKMNIKRLDVPWQGTPDFRPGRQHFVGSAFGLTQRERSRVEDTCPGLHLLDCDAYNFLRNCRWFTWE